MNFKNKILCHIGKHDYISELRTYDVFSTKWADTKEISNWQVHFLKCKCCGNRKFYTDHYGSVHKAIDYTKHQWLDYGIIADDIRNPWKYRSKPTEPNVSNLTVDNKVAKLLMKALDTQSYDEAESCFKMARKAYENAKGKTT